ncbi:hypothetical protein HOU08_gp198 [Dickeya phage vB_DsoM_JA29]|uniref:Uncharacterized protein n=1 Tax=Dickeya phage vB_DsoM_JA29 TaxID=2283031 RepID=A0A384ZXG0_9CAUD|nr:hypothetical protein HOU08_gp198 [Dickeya phage vB_DsoM_JA29]AXG66924.1 hypothetical protein JA29_198 [Dickeya phage vB_DsoM_JA29]
MSATIEEILEDLDRVFEATSFDERKSRFNVVSYKVESLFQEMKVHLMPQEDSAFLNKIRYVVPSPDSIRCLEMVVIDFKQRRQKRFQYAGATTGRTSHQNLNRSAPPRSETRNETYQQVYAGDVSHTIHHDHVTHHAPSSCDSPSSDYGSDSGSGGCD